MLYLKAFLYFLFLKKKVFSLRVFWLLGAKHQHFMIFWLASTDLSDQKAMSFGTITINCLLVDPDLGEYHLIDQLIFLL